MRKYNQLKKNVPENFVFLSWPVTSGAHGKQCTSAKPRGQQSTTYRQTYILLQLGGVRFIMKGLLLFS